MAVSVPTLDEWEPRGIIIQAGAPRTSGAPFWAYMWSDEVDPGAPAGTGRSRMSETIPPPDQPTNASM